MHKRQFLIATLPALLLAACNSGEDADATVAEQVAQPAPVLTPAPIATAAPDGTALEAGEWMVTEDADGARATYGPPGTGPVLKIACTPSTRTVQMFLASDAPAAEAWRLDAGGEAARIDMMPADGTASEIVGTVDQGLAIIQAIGATQQVFTLTSPDGQPRQFPAHPGIRRVLDSCS
jgi:hypothetical protein